MTIEKKAMCEKKRVQFDERKAEPGMPGYGTLFCKSCLVAVITAFSVAFGAFANENPVIAVTASLRDGSTVKGEFRTAAIKGKTIFAKDLSLQAEIVRSVTLDGENGESKVELLNGDRFAMTISNPSFSIKSLLGELKIPCASFRSLSLTKRSGVNANLNATNATGLVYYCTFNSKDEVVTPQFGPPGIFHAGEFTDGVDGLALHVPPFTSAAKFELPPGTIGRQGTIEFWGRIDERNAHLTIGGCPRFFEIICYGPRDEISQDWNSNNGSGGAGLTFRIGGLPVMASSRYTSPNYDFIENDLYGWHHYALVWSADGGITANKAMAVVFVDGCPVMTTSAPNWEGPPLANYCSFLVFPCRENEMPSYAKVGYTIDEFKVWNIAKTNFDLSVNLPKPIRMSR